MSQDGANMADGAQPRAVGAIVRNRYRILSVVGRGGLGVVYRVADVLYTAHNIFALKELSDPAPGARKQFELESSWLQALDHHNIPRVRESFEWDGRSYLVMDFVDGENLEQYLHRLGHPLPEDQALRWMLPICDALQYLHTRTPPLLHRDVKPANIIVTPDGHPVLVDFGIAKAHLPGMNQTLTFVRKAGTEGYAPPEQYAATGMTGPWSDVYALGATLYQLLTGQVPQTAVERITGDAPMPSPRTLNPMITPGTDAAIMCALELKPGNRYQTIKEFATQMIEALQLARYNVNPPDVSPLSSGNSAPPQGPAQATSFPTVNMPPHLPPQPSPWPQRSGSSRPYGHSAPRSPSAPVSASLPPLGNPIPSNLPIGSHTPAHAPVSGVLATPMAMPVAFPYAPAAPAPMPSPSTTQKTEAARPPEPKRQRRGPPLAALITVLVILMAAVGGLSVFAYNTFAPPDRSTPQATVSGYFTTLEQQNYSRAWQYSSASRNDPGSEATFDNELSSDDAHYGKVLNFTITQSQSDNAGHTEVTVSVARANAPNAPLTYIVSVTQYSGPVWLIDSASSQ